MRGDFVLFLYLLLILLLSLLLEPTYTFAVIKFGQILNKQSDEYLTNALELGKDPNQHWCFFENNEFKPVFQSCPWTIETPTERLEVTIT